MKVQLAPQQNSTMKNNANPQFKGVVDTSFRFLATNQAIGANGVDFCFMVMPRSASDMINRGPAAGLETFRREIMGTVNDTCIGLFGAGAGALIAFGINKEFGLNVNKLFTAPETLNILAENKAEQLKNKQTQLDYIKRTLSEVKGYNPGSERADAEGFVKLSQKTIDDAAAMFDKALSSASGENLKSWTSNSSCTVRNGIINRITEDTGAQTSYILESKDKKIASHTNLKSLVNDIFITTKSFDKEKVKTAFEEQVKAGKPIAENAYIKAISKFMKTRAGVGFALASALGLSVQPMNMYLTKLKTGCDGFVGVEGRSKDNSNEFKAIKTGSSAAFFSMILATLGLSPAQFIKSPKLFMDKMAFTGKMPTVNQLKGIYGITIISRIFSARDKDELREVLTKDTLGYLSWLVLGDFVNRLTAEGLDKSVVNFKKGTENSAWYKRAFYSSLKSRDEILVEALAKQGVRTTKEQNGKTVAKSFKEMVKDLDKISNAEVKAATKKHLKTLNRAQFAGYLFSGLVLGLGIPNLNIYVTNTLDKRRKEKAAKQNAVVAEA